MTGHVCWDMCVGTWCTGVGGFPVGWGKVPGKQSVPFFVRVCVCVCRQSVCSGCGCLSPYIRLLSPLGLLAFLGSLSSCPASSLSRLKVGALVDEGGTLQDLVQPQMLPEASLLLPLPFFPPFPPSLSFPSSLPPKAGVPGGGTCQSLAVPLRLPAQGAAPPGSQVFGSQETLQAPGEAVKLRTLQTPL